jgi:hypothetical protein
VTLSRRSHLITAGCGPRRHTNGFAKERVAVASVNVEGVVLAVAVARRDPHNGPTVGESVDRHGGFRDAYGLSERQGDVRDSSATVLVCAAT